MLKKVLGKPAQWLEPMRFFVLLGSVFGLLFLLITPPFQGTDEQLHFMRSYQIASGNLAVDVLPQGNGGMLPASVQKTIDITANNPAISFNPQNKYDLHHTKAALEVPLQDEKKQFFDFTSTAVYAPVSYLATSLPMVFTHLLDLPAVVQLYAGRLGNLAMWLVLMGLAIYLMPRRKWAMVFVGLLPMALFQASTLNSDVMAIGTVAVFVAYILRLREQENKLSWKQMGLVLLIAAALALSKQITFVVLPLVLLLPNRLFDTKKWALGVKAAVIVLPLLFAGGWMVVSAGADTSALYASQNHQDPGLQLKHIIEAPYRYAFVLVNTFAFTWGDGITRSFIGTFGWADTPLAEPIVVIGYAAMLLLFSATTATKFKAWLTGREKLLVLGVALLFWLAVSTSLYMYFSPVDLRIVYGLQGRYFIPLAILAIPLLWSNIIRMPETAYKRLAIGAPIFLLSASLVTITVRYFIHNV